MVRKRILTAAAVGAAVVIAATGFATAQSKKHHRTSATTSTTMAPPPAPKLKPVISGVCDRQGVASSESLGVVNCAVVNADWSALQPTAGGAVAANNVIDQAIAETDRLNAATPGLNLRLKLRVFAGIAAPDWAKNLDGPPVTLHATQTTAVDTVPRFWTARFGAAYDNLMTQLAARYDNVPVLLDVAVSRCMTYYAEPLLRQAGDASNRSAYMAAGYSVTQDQACQRAQIDTHARLWKRTRSSMAFNPYQSVDSADGWHTDEAFTEQMMDYCRGALGLRCVLGNNSLSSPPDDGPYTPMYQKIAALGAPMYFQTATAARIGDWRATLDWAVAQGANMVELPSGYASWPPAEIAARDTRLEANRAP